MRAGAPLAAAFALWLPRAAFADIPPEGHQTLASQLPYMPPAGLAILAALCVALAVSVATDLRCRLILDVVTLPVLALVLGIYARQGGTSALTDSILGLAVCAGPFFVAAFPRWMGWGDAKLMAVVGAALGWPLAFMALLYVSIAGGAQALLWIVFAKLRGREKPKYVPYAVAIAAGTLGAFLLG